ncbi:MAG: hypothetical protein EXS59_01820 [Candidatus Taylorbacteria bacterium]|nr:hypothetical protein [Candidatus Taylorbacteria bacterium]
MTTNQNSQACQSGQSAAGSAQMIQILGCVQTVRLLKKQYNRREMLSIGNRRAFDEFVAGKGNRFGQTEAGLLFWLVAEGELYSTRGRVLQKVTEYYTKQGYFPKRIHAIRGKLYEFAIRMKVPHRSWNAVRVWTD